jgi:mevalonate kinase
MRVVKVPIPFRLDLAMGGISDLPEWSRGGRGGALGLAVMIGEASSDGYVVFRELETDRFVVSICRGNSCERWTTSDAEKLSPPLALILSAIASAQGLDAKSTAPREATQSLKGCHVEVALPKSKGLGSSTSTACAVIVACKRWLNRSVTFDDVVALSSQADRAVGTLAGWEDSIPALVGGAVRTLNAVGGGSLSIDKIKVSHRIQSSILVFDTGQDASTGRILSSALLHLQREPDAVKAHSEALLEEVEHVYQALVLENWPGLGESLNRQSSLWQKITRSASLPESIQYMLKSIEEYTFGAKLAGAGGGGMLIVVPKPQMVTHIQDELLRHGCAKVPWRVYLEGMIQ